MVASPENGPEYEDLVHLEDSLAYLETHCLEMDTVYVVVSDCQEKGEQAVDCFEKGHV